MLAGASRDPSMTVVHARGLTLEEVGYPDGAELAAQAVRTRARDGRVARERMTP